MSDEIKADQVLDCSGLSCPQPILKTKKAIKAMDSGQVLMVTSTDPGTNKDMTSFADKTGNKLLKIDEKEGSADFYLQAK
jgi:tRNA 2-thiouridine synthesizing protein A